MPTRTSESALPRAEPDEPGLSAAPALVLAHPALSGWPRLAPQCWHGGIAAAVDARHRVLPATLPPAPNALLVAELPNPASLLATPRQPGAGAFPELIPRDFALTNRARPATRESAL